MTMFLARVGTPLVLGDGSADEDQPDRLSLSRLLINEEILIKASDESVASTGFRHLPRAPLSVEDLRQLIGHLQGLSNRAIRNTGKIIVRYVGDLKPTEYTLDARFFHLAETVSQNELTGLIEETLKLGRSETDLINLANVRDIKVKVGHRAVVGIEDELEFARRAQEVLASWVAGQCGAQVVDA